MIAETRAAFYRRQIALLTVGQGKFQSANFAHTFVTIIQKINEMKPKMNGLDAEADIQFIEDQRRQHSRDEAGYINQMQDILDQEEEGKLRTAPTPSVGQPATATPAPQSQNAFPSQSNASVVAATIPEKSFLMRIKPLLAAAATLFVVCWLLGIGGLSCGIIRTVCYDSGWVEVNNKTTRVWSFDHGMSFTPTDVTLLFRPPGEEEHSYPLSSYAGNPINIVVSPRQINVHVFSGSPLRSTFDATTSQWQTFSEGRYRVIAR